MKTSEQLQEQIISLLHRVDARLRFEIQERIIPLLHRVGARLRIEMPLKSLQRKVLEQTIIPFYANRHDIKKVLFVGCDYYTSHYWKFFRSKEFWTIEPDRGKKVFGSKYHIVDKLENLHRHFEPDYFDLIICNGVYGWGLNSKEQCEIGFQNCYNYLRGGGELMLGWNDLPERGFVPLENIKSIAKFRHQPHSPFSSWRYHTGSPNRHVFDFYVK
jgi:SAM-dependent methyltransferase